MPQQVGSPIAEGSAGVAFMPSAKRVRAVVNGVTVADSLAVGLLLERDRRPLFYFPRADVRTDLLTPSQHRSTNSAVGEASYWTLTAAGRRIEDALWSHAAPAQAVAAIKDYLAFDAAKVDHWYEEDEEVFGHARDPYHRIDVRASAREVRITCAGAEVAMTRHGLFLFETGLPTRYYIPPEDVRFDRLERSASRTVCPYKGWASYWSLRSGDRLVADAAWSYEDPLPECPRIKGYLCFYPEKVEIAVAGEAAGVAER